MAKIWTGTKRHRAVEASERAETARWLQDVIAEVESADGLAAEPLDAVNVVRKGALEVA